MAKPNSLTTRLRLRLTRWLDPWPDNNEGWCIGCSLNNRRTTVLSGGDTGLRIHVDAHHMSNPGESLNVKTCIPHEEA